MTNLEAKQALARKLDIDYSDIANNDVFSATDLQFYIQVGAQQAWDSHPWDFTEGAKTGTLSSTNITNGYLDYPQDMVTGGANLLTVNNVEFAPKLTYQDYRKALEDDSVTTDKIWTEYKRFLFMNMNACTAGQSFDVYGKLRCPTLSGDSDLLPFSPDVDNQEDSGNNAIVDLAYAEVLESDKKKNPTGAQALRAKAYAVLDLLWKPMSAYKSNQQANERPFFNVPDFFS